MAPRRPRQDKWSRAVGWLKVGLPLLALAFLSTLFLVSNRINPEDAIPYAKVDVAERLREPRMTDAKYAGSTSDGASIVVQAAEARPAANGQNATAADAFASLTTPDGKTTTITAATVSLDDSGTRATLGGGVTMADATGITITAQGLIADLRETYVTSTKGTVSAAAPAGKVTADSLTLRQGGNADTDSGANGYLLVFNGNVKLIYHPPE